MSPLEQGARRPLEHRAHRRRTPDPPPAAS